MGTKTTIGGRSVLLAAMLSVAGCPNAPSQDAGPDAWAPLDGSVLDGAIPDSGSTDAAGADTSGMDAGGTDAGADLDAPVLSDAGSLHDTGVDGGLRDVGVDACARTCGPTNECGADGCGGMCGPCGAGTICSMNRCVATCVPSCAGRTCGTDGCGGTCGSCGSNATCNASGQCQCNTGFYPSPAGTFCIPGTGSCAGTGVTENGYCADAANWIWCDPVLGLRRLDCASSGLGSCRNLGGGVGACACSGPTASITTTGQCGTLSGSGLDAIYRCNAAYGVIYAVNCREANPSGFCATFATGFGSGPSCMCGPCNPYDTTRLVCLGTPCPGSCGITSGSPPIHACL